VKVQPEILKELDMDAQLERISSDSYDEREGGQNTIYKWCVSNIKNDAIINQAISDVFIKQLQAEGPEQHIRLMNLLRQVVHTRKEYVGSGFIGITMGAAAIRLDGVMQNGANITGFHPDGNAKASGFQIGDIIYRIDAQSLHVAGSSAIQVLIDHVKYKAPSDKIQVYGGRGLRGCCRANQKEVSQ